MSDILYKEVRDLIRSRTGYSVVGGGDGYVLVALAGKDWLGPGYDGIRSRALASAHETGRILAKATKRGVYLVSGSETSPNFAWPVWVRV